MEYDAENLGDAHRDCKAFLRLLEANGVNLLYVRCFASGRRGFHVEVPEGLLGIREPLLDLPYVFRDLLRELTATRDLPTLDWNVYSGGRGRMWRIPNVRRANGRYKIPLTAAEVLHLATEDIEALTAAPREVTWPEEEPDPVPGLVEMFQKAREAASEREAAEPVAPDTFGGKPPPCLDLLASGKFSQSPGTFNRIALTLAGYAVAAGMGEVDFTKWTNPLAIEFKASGTYDSVPARVKHLRAEYRYVKSEPRYQRFACLFVFALHIPEIDSCCFRCEVSRNRQKVAHALKVAAEVVERVKSGDPGAPFEPEALQALRLVRDKRPADWQRIRAELKKSGIKLRDLDKELKRRDRSHGQGNCRDDDAGGLPWIDAQEGDLAKLAEEAWEAVKRSNDPPHLFQRGGVMTRIRVGDDGAPHLEAVSEAALRGVLARVAFWFRRGEDGAIRPAHPPLDVVRDMQAAPEMPLPAIGRVVQAPFFTSDGELVTEPGYHPAARVWYQQRDGLVIPEAPAHPAPAQIKQALSVLLDDLLVDFPFVSQADKANALAMLLLPFVREMISGPTPLHLVEAPTPGTGKGLLVDVLAIPFLGGSIPTMTEGQDEDEWRKRITAKLLTGPSFVLIDNLRRRLDSAALSAAITSPAWEDRILGRSQTVALPVKCVWVATGNNPALSLEIARRAVRIRIDAKMARPWERTEFRHKELRVWARERRGHLIWAALSLIQAWIAASKPPGERSLGMFECWARTMSGILKTAGVSGFLDNAGELYAQADAETQMWEAFCGAWWDQYGARAVTTTELHRLALSADLLLEVLGDRGEHSQKTRLGRALGSVRDRQVGRWRITLDGEARSRALLWRLVPAETPSPRDSASTQSGGGSG